MEEKIRIHWERFYSAYPKKEGRGNALKSWEKITKGMTPEELEAFTLKVVLAIDAQKRQKWDHGERKYIPMPATWLNQSRWDDEVKSVTEPTERQDESCVECGKKAFNRKYCCDCYTKLVHPQRKQEMLDWYKSKGGLKRNPGEKWDSATRRFRVEHGYMKDLPGEK